MKMVVATIAAVMMMGSFAKADGFLCESESGLNIKIFNKTNPTEGTRNAAVMIISDSTVGIGNKTIAKFESEETLTSHSSVYVANVDLRYNNSNRRGENIGGTKLGQLDKIIATMDFGYSDGLRDGDQLRGLLKLIKRNGTYKIEELACERYLKN